MRSYFAGICLVLPQLLFAQMPPGLAGKDNPFVLRKVDPKARCQFAGEYDRIKKIKRDPRVAYIELNAIVSGTTADFTQSCKAITEQTEDSVTTFDRANGYLAIFFGRPEISTTVTYFAGKNGAPGIVLYVDRTDESAWSIHVFRSKLRWVDESKKYLGPLQLGPHDYFVAPEYGTTGLILTEKDGRFTHKEWVKWDGSQFVVGGSGKDWRCPKAMKYLERSERQAFCEVGSSGSAADGQSEKVVDGQAAFGKRGGKL